MKLHIHVWEEGKEDPVEEADFEMTDAYISGDESDHYQFMGKVAGKQLEIRLLEADLKKEAYDSGHRHGFKNGKEQLKHDIKRAIEEMEKTADNQIGGKTFYFKWIALDEVKHLLKKYTEE